MSRNIDVQENPAQGAGTDSCSYPGPVDCRLGERCGCSCCSKDRRDLARSRDRIQRLNRDISSEVARLYTPDEIASFIDEMLELNAQANRLMELYPCRQRSL